METAKQYHQVGMMWNPQEKRKRGRPRINWQRDLEADTTKMGYTWSQLENMAQDRGLWRTVVCGPYPDKDKGHESDLDFSISVCVSYLCQNLLFIHLPQGNDYITQACKDIDVQIYVEL
ncbi:hypothetical protein BsWGS_26433 [Bradybaena similaris]